MATAKPRKGIARKPPRAGKTIVSVADLCGDAEAILAGARRRRLAIGRDPALARLATAVNGIVDLLGSKERLLGENIQSLQQVNRELRETQENSLRNEKLVALGRVAAGIAHEIGNPIGAILGYIDLLKGGPALDSEVSDSLTRMEAAAWRINGIIRELLDFARPSFGLFDSLDLNRVIEETLEEVGKQPGFAQVTLRRELDCGMPCITANHHRLRQLLVNLLTNAADASGGGGTIVIATRSFESIDEPRPAPPRSPRRTSDPPPLDDARLRPVVSYDPTADRRLDAEAKWVEVRIADSGQGIPPQVLREVFDPFFTTKPPGKGTGLGLPLSLSIVRSLKGRMQLASAPGAGTTVIVQIPATNAESPPPP